MAKSKSRDNGLVISLVNQKGGGGKSSTSVHLLYWLSQKASVCLVDADAQKSSSIWVKFLELPFEVIQNYKAIASQVPEIAKEYDYVVVDGPAAIERETRAILSVSDLTLVPVQPSEADLHPTGNTIRLIRDARSRLGKPKSAVFLNRSKTNSLLERESARTLKKMSDVPFLGIVRDRTSIADAYGQGCTVWQLPGDGAEKAAREYEQLFKAALGVLDA